MKKIVATGKTSLSNNTEMHVGPTPPLYPVEGQLWLNTSDTPPSLWKWDGEQWVLQEMDVTKLDPDLVENVNSKINANHQKLLDEIAQINADSARLKAEVEARNKQDDQYFSDMRQTIINNRYEALGWYAESDGRISGIAQSVDGITTRVGKAETNISTLTQTADGLQSTVTSIANGTHSVITQMSDRINLRVEKDNIVSQLNLSSEGVYIAGKLLYLDGNVNVAGTFTAPKVISTNSNNTEYTKIEGRKLISYGYYSGDWSDGYISGYHSLTANLGYIAMKQETGSWSNNTQPILYYTSRGITTQFGAPKTASGTIEFFATGYNTSVNSLRIKSSGNIILETTTKKDIHINPLGGSVYICNDGSTYYDLYCKKVYAYGGVEVGGSIHTNKNLEVDGGANIGNFTFNETNFNLKSLKIRMGDSSGKGNITMDGTLTADTVKYKTLTQDSQREVKKNIVPFDENATAIVADSIVRNFSYNDDVDGIDFPRIGLIVDEAPLEVINPTGTGVLISDALWIAWKAIQELDKRIKELEGTA